MTIHVDCPCGHFFEAPTSLAGGITNCPACGKAVEVPGLRDPLWRLLQLAGAIAWLLAVWIAWRLGGVSAAAIAAVAMAAFLWLASRAL